jgi:hypothetical protein
MRSGPSRWIETADAVPEVGGELGAKSVGVCRAMLLTRR